MLHTLKKWLFLLFCIITLIGGAYYVFYRNIRVIEITPPTQTIREDIGHATQWIQKQGEKATRGTKKAAESVHEAVKNVYHTAADALSAVTNVRSNLEEIATTIEELPTTITQQTALIDALPEQFDRSLRDLTSTITYIKQTQHDLGLQAADIHKKFQASTVPEIIQLNKALSDAFSELEKALSLLASPHNDTGILYNFKTALATCKQKAETGSNTIKTNITVLDEKINHPTDTSAGYLTLPDRIRAVAAVFNPFAEQ